METKDFIEELKTLTQYEIDGALLVDQAITKLRNKQIKDQFQIFKRECEENIIKLSECIKNLGGEPPSYSKDIKGYFMQVYEAIRGIVSDKGIMEALDTNTKPLMKYYDRVLSLDVPEEERVNRKSW